MKFTVNGSLQIVHFQLHENEAPNFDKNHELPFQTENYTLYNRSFENLKPNTEYAFQLVIIYWSVFELYHWPRLNSDQEFVFKTLSKYLVSKVTLHVDLTLSSLDFIK